MPTREHGYHHRHDDPMIEAAYRRRLNRRDGRTFLMALAERYEKNEARARDRQRAKDHDSGPAVDLDSGLGRF